MVSIDDIQAAAARLAKQIVQTPCLQSTTMSNQLGCELYLKFENLQFTSSFKERGALNFLAANAAELGKGVIAMSAGNHAQALAYHGQRMGIPTTIVMPRFTPNAKVEATKVFGAEVHLEGNDFDATLKYTEGLAKEKNQTLVHPFNDPLVIAGQGTVALEMLEAVPDLDVLVVPVGGGGLIAGMAVAVKHVNPAVQVVGVQTSRYPGAYRVRHGETNSSTGEVIGTIAEGIAVKEPGTNTMPLIEQLVDQLAVVDEADIEDAIFSLMEIEKTVVEGAGAAPLALLNASADDYRGKKVGIVLSGGNIDMMMLSSVLQRGLVRASRLVRLKVEIPDTPGALASLTQIVGGLDSNIIDIEHQRAFAGSSVRSTVVELLLQMRGEEQQQDVMAALANAGYQIL